MGFCLPNSSALIVGYYATWCAGGTVVPANPAAVVINLVAVNPAGGGNLIAYPTGGSVPISSVLNYQSGITALANGATSCRQPDAGQ